MLMTGMDNDVNKALVAMLDRNNGAEDWDGVSNKESQWQ